MVLIEFIDMSIDRGEADTVAVTGPLNGVEIHLYQTPIEVTEETPLSAFTAAEADYSGYALEAVTWGPATQADDGEIEFIGTAGEFRPTGSAVQNTIYGLWVESAGGALYLAGPLDAAAPMASTLDSILVTLRYRPAAQTLAVIIS